MDQIIIKANMFLQNSNLIPVVRFLFPECQVHVVPTGESITPEPEANSSTVTPEMESHQDA